MAHDYLFRIAEQGNCPALFPAGVFECDGRTIVIWDKSGHMDLVSSCLNWADGSKTGLIEAFSDMSCMVFCALSEAEDWLIPPEALDLKKDRVGCDPADKKVRFCLNAEDITEPFRGRYSGKDLIGVFELLREVFSSAAPGIPFPLAPLEKRTISEDLGIKSIIKQLGLMRMR